MPIETHENCAVLFADMSGSTKLYLVVGDDKLARSWRRRSSAGRS
jgi:class 3 adenylate cyclase